MKQSVPRSVEEYIAAQPPAVRPKLEQVRAAIRRAVPEAVEVIGSGPRRSVPMHTLRPRLHHEFSTLL